MLCFVHIERSAGNTLHALFSNNHPSYLLFAPFYWPVGDDVFVTTQELRQLLRLFPFAWGFGGHSVRSYCGYEAVTGPLQYVTFLREPVGRYLAHFNHQSRGMGLDWNFEAFVAEKRFSNLATQKICGSLDVEEAKRHLAEDYAFAGIAESYDECLLLMRHELGLPGLRLQYERENTARESGYRARFTPEQIATARAENALDIELYEFVQRELLPRYRSHYPGDLEADQVALARSKEGFRFSRARRLLWRTCQIGGYRLPQAILRRVHHPDDPFGLLDGLRFRLATRLRRRDVDTRRIGPQVRRK